jgi:hypothetical protein
MSVAAIFREVDVATVLVIVEIRRDLAIDAGGPLTARSAACFIVRLACPELSP